MGSLAGTQSPAIFSDLITAQNLQKVPNKINTVYYSVDGKYDHEAAYRASFI